jgi:hypothetical protein
MADLSRRTFLGASAAAAGAAVMGAPIAVASASAPAAVPVALPKNAPAEPFMVYVADASAGDVSIMIGTDEVTSHDPDLVARLVRAADRKS